MRIAEHAGSRQNNFNALRLIAAVMVLVSHSFPLTGHAEPVASIFGQTLGELGVSIFFAISGFLIAKSWADDPDPLHFAIKRALRLIPALVTAVLLTALVVGPIVSTLSLSSYLARFEVYRYIAENSVLYTVNGRLPGVFVHNVYPAAVNGSLWTLPVESIAYVAAAVLGVVGALRERVGLTILSFIALLLLSTPLLDVGAISVSGPVGSNLGLILYLGGLFNAGVLLFALRERLVLRWDIAALLAAVWIATFDTAWVRTGAMLAIPYLVLVLAYRTPRWVSAITRPGDLSYGIYVYAFPAQQVAAYAWGPRLGPGTMLALVAIPVYVLALLSWRLIEAPALRLKRRLTPRAETRPVLA
jgi:peptidoglycan/LPS O-acetylase OafA/YrhL